MPWYVLNHILRSGHRDEARRAVERFNRSRGVALRLFAPTYVVREQTPEGQTRMRVASLTFHYIFVQGDLSQVKQLCSLENGFSLLLNHGGSERYAIIPDAQMRHFQTIARAYENNLPYYPLADIELESGDLVEVVNGDFPGLIGTYMPRHGGKSGNIVLQVAQNLGTIAYDIKATDVRVLRFAKDSTRAYDQIDAFVPRLLDAIQSHCAGMRLTTAQRAVLAVFFKRMEVVKLANVKLEAKLQALLCATAQILGDVDQAETRRLRYRRISASITNQWTKALAEYIIASTCGSRSEALAAAEKIAAMHPETKMQHTIHRNALAACACQSRL